MKTYIIKTLGYRVLVDFKNDILVTIFNLHFHITKLNFGLIEEVLQMPK